MRKLATMIAASCAMLWVTLPCHSEEPVRLIMPFAAGSSTDAIARILAELLRGGLKRSVIVENKVGAAGRLGVQAVKSAAPDGNTLLLSPIAPMAVYPHVYADLAYDPIQDFEPISQIATFDFAVAVAREVPAKTLRELVEWLKTNSSSATYGTPGAGTLPHLFAVSFARSAGIELRHVPFKGSSAAVNELLGSHISIAFSNTGELSGFHKDGQIRILATSGAARSPFLQDVPTFREAGYDILGTGWLGVFAPRGTPESVLGQLNTLLVTALQSSEVKDKLLAMGFVPTGTSRQDLAAIQRTDSDVWAAAVKTSGFKARP
jgi:tripartite-type tricarboxylate transporter receptor subunit TctC